MPRLPLHIQSQIPVSHLYFQVVFFPGRFSTGLGTRQALFLLVLFFSFPLMKENTKAPAVVQDEQHAPSAVSAVCPGSHEGY